MERKALARKILREDRLRAAFQAGGFNSWQKLAKMARVSHPTLSRVLSGDVEAVNPTTLDRLALALKVPAEWLTGERNDLPYVPERYPWDKKGGPSLWERPTEALVRNSWLMQQVEAAIKRDLEEWYGERANEAYETWGRDLFEVFSELSSSVVWRLVSLEASPKGSGYALLETDDSRTVEWLTCLLQPWFDGLAYLNADGLRGVFEGLLASPARMWGSQIRDDDARRALSQYAAESAEAQRRHLAATFEPEDDETGGDLGDLGDFLL